MNRAWLRHLSPSLVISLIALVIAMGGAAYAGSLVTSKDIKNGTIKDVDIHANQITGDKIRDGTIAAPDLASTSQVVSSSLSIAANGNNSVTVACPAGSRVLSGGGGASSFLVAGIESFQSGNGWIWVAHNFDGNAHTIFATAVCLSAPVEARPATSAPTKADAGDGSTPPQPKEG